MSRRTAFWAGFVTVFFVLCAKTTLLSTLFALIVLGIIPGTNFTVPSWVILTLYPATFLLVIGWLSTQQLFIGEARHLPCPETVTIQPKKTSRRKSATTAKQTTSVVA